MSDYEKNVREVVIENVRLRSENKALREERDGHKREASIHFTHTIHEGACETCYLQDAAREKAEMENARLKKELGGANAEAEFLEAVAEAADKLAGKLGTKDHPAQAWYEDALVELDCALSRLDEVRGKEEQ